MIYYSLRLQIHHPSHPSCSCPRRQSNMSVCGTTSACHLAVHLPPPPHPFPPTFTRTPRMAPSSSKGAA